MNADNSTLHFMVAFAAGLLTGVSGLGALYVLEHAYGVSAPKESPLLMMVAVLTIAASLFILNWREDFNAMLDGEKPLTRHAVFRVWLAVFAFWVTVVVFGSVNAAHIQGPEWYQQMPGALIFYIVPTFIWLHLSRMIVRTRYLKREADVRAS